jgi:hypothetical protein
VARRQSAPPRRRPIQTLLLVGGAAAVLVVAIAAVVLGQGTGPKTGLGGLRSPSVRPTTPPTPNGTGPASVGPITINGVTCDPAEQVTYHVHAHLNIRVNGQLEPIPDDVGRTPTCLFWLHTHATQGVIHVEAPVARSFTLGQFFDVWGKPLSATQVGDWAVPAGSRIWVFLDGEPVDTDPRTIELTNLASIELQIGPSRLDPLPYTWPADFT